LRINNQSFSHQNAQSKFVIINLSYVFITKENQKNHFKTDDFAAGGSISGNDLGSNSARGAGSSRTKDKSKKQKSDYDE
jgi:hypothetical protein